MTTRVLRSARVVALSLTLAACGAALGAAPEPDGTGPAAVSSVGAGELAQLLTAPRPDVLPVVMGPDSAAEPEPWGPPYRTGPNASSPIVIPPPALPEGDGTVFAVGDSVLLGTEPYLPTAIGGWQLRIDARVSRAYPEGIDVVNDHRRDLGQAAVVGLGHNYWGGGKVYRYLDQLMAPLRNVERVVVVTAAEWSSAQVEVNAAIRALPKTYPNVVVADWAAVAAANPQFLVSDRVHPTPGGDVALANLIAVMLGPARPVGKTVAPPRLLPIPAGGAPVAAAPNQSTGSAGNSSPRPAASPTSTSSAPLTTTPVPSSSTTAVPSTTTRPSPSTTVSPPTTSAPAPSTNTTAKPTSP